MKHHKLLKSIFLALLLSASALSASAYDFMVDDLAYVYNNDGTSVTVTSGGNYSGDIIIPESVTTYNGNTYSVTSIGSWAFEGCSGLTSVTIPNSVTSIGDCAFSYCSGLTSMVVENGNSTYDSRNNCNAIIETATNTLKSGCKNTVIPNSVTSIGSWAFEGCSGLTSVTIPNSVTSIGKESFSGCSGLTSLTIGNSVTSIGVEAFSGCSGLTSVTIPNSVTSIGYKAFYGCSSLTCVMLGENLHTIGQGAFEGSNKIETVTCKRFRPAAVNGDEAIFNSDTYNNATLYVPKGSLSLYYSAPDWMKFLNIQELDDGGQTPLKGDVNGDGRVNVSDVSALINIILGIQ